MADSKPALNYTHAHLYLKPEEDNVAWRNHRAKYNQGVVDFVGDSVRLSVGGRYLLDMQGISVPLEMARKPSPDKRVVEAVRALVGNCDAGLAEYVRLAEKGFVQNDSLYFTPDGLFDYSRGIEHEGNLTSWLAITKSRSGDIAEYFHGDTKIPVGLQIKFVPEYQAIRDVPNFHPGKDKLGLFTGTTFADRINSFLSAYNTVQRFVEWRNLESRRMRIAGKVMVNDVVPVAGIVLE